MSPIRTATLALLAGLAACATPALARGGGWGGPGWNDRGWSERAGTRTAAPDRSGQVQVARFLAEGDAAAALGKGAITVTEAAVEGGVRDARQLAVFEAAVIDELARVGYDTASPAAEAGQVTEVRLVRDVAEPPEAPRKPVSGEMAVGVSNHGSMVGMGINIDLTRPRGALLSTRLEARIKDRASGAVLWEGRADILTREGDSHWGDQQIATRLARALFDGFPGQSGESVVRR